MRIISINYIYSHKFNLKLVLMTTLKGKTMAKYLNVTLNIPAKSGFLIYQILSFESQFWKILFLLLILYISWFNEWHYFLFIYFFRLKFGYYSCLYFKHRFAVLFGTALLRRFWRVPTIYIYMEIQKYTKKPTSHISNWGLPGFRLRWLANIMQCLKKKSVCLA